MQSHLHLDTVYHSNSTSKHCLLLLNISCQRTSVPLWEPQFLPSTPNYSFSVDSLQWTFRGITPTQILFWLGFSLRTLVLFREPACILTGLSWTKVPNLNVTIGGRYLRSKTFLNITIIWSRVLETSTFGNSSASSTYSFDLGVLYLSFSWNWGYPNHNKPFVTSAGQWKAFFYVDLASSFCSIVGDPSFLTIRYSHGRHLCNVTEDVMVRKNNQLSYGSQANQLFICSALSWHETLLLLTNPPFFF